MHVFSKFFLLFVIALTSSPLVHGQQKTTQSVDLKRAKALLAEVQLNAGTLTLTTHPLPNADLNFAYSRSNWKPLVKATKEANRDHLIIRQPEEKNTNMGEREHNKYTIKIPQALETSLKLRMGAGEGKVDMHGAKINRVDMEAGAGDFNVNLANTSVASLKVSAGVGALTLNLGGARTRDLDADISGGIGDLTLVLPRSSGVRVRVSGLGGIDNKGLRKQNGYYVNDAYGKSAQNVDITVSAGLGNIKMTLEK
ncbi:DUF4097 family beta strand repeat-containing protein [Adhaeribacter aquaticus]|uniref:DUF4097 family beta strand repeat-containing protein n=1 Tax=Adhaeribacter aquaticus TaxID=299567 RepID=UPI00047B3105|nr:LiaF domain-containing protein [Adhaeribacter aquaticus]